MFDIEVAAPYGAASLAEIGRVLGDAGVGLEGGGMWSGAAHYLVADNDAARDALKAAGIGRFVSREAVVTELDADVPGALGRMMRRIADGGVVLLGQYSDHDNRKVLIVDDAEALRRTLEADSAP